MASKHQVRGGSNKGPGGEEQQKKCFHLFENEELVECPYNISHQITNQKMMNHLVKCRRNYQKSFEKEGNVMSMLACKYNWTHQVLAPEIVYHERNCPDRYNVVPYLISSAEDERKKKEKEQKGGDGGPVKVDVYFTAAAANASRTKEENFGNRMANMRLNDTNKSGSSAQSKPKYSPEVEALLHLSPDEDWEHECRSRGYATYDPTYKLESELMLDYPANLSKSERRAWKIQNMEKAKRMYGDAIHDLPRDDYFPDVEPGPDMPNNYFRARYNNNNDSTDQTTDEYTTNTDGAEGDEDTSSVASFGARPRSDKPSTDRYKDFLEESLRSGLDGLRKKKINK